MPVHAATKNGKPGFQWGTHGKIYTYTRNDKRSRARAKQKAQKQARAIYASGWRE